MELFDMWPVDENNCWITGQAGIILRTNDGGQSWTTLDAGTNHWTYGICFIDNLTGWIGTTGGTIHKTTDGGNSWQEQYDGDRSIMDIWFVNSMKGWATEGEFILFTDDGGTTWIRQPTGDLRELTRLCFIDDHTGWAVGVLGKIIFTSDGGAPVEDYSKPMLDVNVFPNPTSEKLNITLIIPQSGTLKINIYNGSGDLVEVLVNDKYTQGVYTLTYNIKLNNLPEGIYLYDITLNTSNQTYNLRDRFVVIY
jgi:photosystem II stability/assembly factor-like uncharacterized protein